MMETLKTDYLVIGSGVAGLRAAIELSRHGNVIVVTKDIISESSTEYAQGGVAVALSDEDEVGIHYNDTLRAGDGLCKPEAVKTLVEEGPDRILELIEWGAQFDSEGSKLLFTLEAAHSKKRVLHAGGDSTGREIQRSLYNKVATLQNVTRYPFRAAVDIIMVDGKCIGATALGRDNLVNIFAKATVLATGGAGQVFSRTTNPEVATGDGIAMAYRAGAVLQDMEFVQFHPTALFLPGAPHFLLSEAMRGEGALLRDINGDLFMSNYHESAELAPRDVVSRAIISQIVKVGGGHVFLDLTHLDANFVRKRFPRIYSTCLKHGIDIATMQIPVSPAAHYIMGGVRTDLDGKTSVPGLFAAGETACTGVHGANRLASNSLLEGLVYGHRTAVAAAAYDFRQDGALAATQAIPGPVPGDFPHLNMEKLRKDIRNISWDCAGIIRCIESLGRARQCFSEIGEIMDCQFDTRAGIELKNILTVATLITEAALLREGSIGAHYRSDFPLPGNNWQRHTCLSKPEKEMIKTWT
jgi:L-aspartate oxidase